MGVTGYGAADKEQVGRMVAVILQLAEVPHARRHGRRAGDRDLHRERGARRGSRQRRDSRCQGRRAGPRGGRPITRGETPYERAVREALVARDADRGEGAARDRAPAGSLKPPPP